MSIPSLWHERSPRERRIAAVIGALAAVVLLITFAWLPLERARAKLSLELPPLRASLGALQRDAEEVKRLRSMPLVAGSSTGPLSAIATSSVLPGAQLALVDEKRVRLTAGDVGASSLVDWLGAARASYGLRVDSARIESLPTSGRVRAELTLSRP
jgi:general secretion pathway protein M